jgi:hypothetical protein
LYKSGKKPKIGGKNNVMTKRINRSKPPDKEGSNR